MTDLIAQPLAAQPGKPDNAIALVSSDDADSLYATVQWLLNPLPGGSLLFERPDPRIAQLESDLAAAQAEREAAIKAAVAAEREAIASEMDCGCDCRDAVLETLRTEGRRKARYQCKFSLECLALQADEIRARGAAHE